jgi:hypothetical protein
MHQQPYKILFPTLKRLFQQYRSIASFARQSACVCFTPNRDRDGADGKRRSGPRANILRGAKNAAVRLISDSPQLKAYG